MHQREQIIGSAYQLFRKTFLQIYSQLLNIYGERNDNIQVPCYSKLTFSSTLNLRALFLTTSLLQIEKYIEYTGINLT